jgi:cystathionine beta-lyase/cystathionine gamma-synthase
MTHASIPAEMRRTLGIGDGLIRLSVGLEDEDDLWEDLARGFSAAAKVLGRLIAGPALGYRPPR